MTRVITLEDCRRHQPGPGAPPSWQESFYLGWVDRKNRICGTHHISLAPGPGRDTHVWSWVMVEGKVVARAQQNGLPLPVGDFDDLHHGVLHLRFSDILRDLSLSSSFDNGVKVDIDFKGAIHPQERPLNLGDTVLGERHYEIMGMATGQVTIEGRTIPIEAGAWTDHSWGARDFSSILSHRWLWASFGADLSISAFVFVTNFGLFYTGWALDQGEVYPVTYAEFHAVVNDDGISPEGCDAIIRTVGNRTYRVRGKVIDNALLGGVGYCVKNGLTEFECGRRMGEGLLEFNELKAPTQAMLKELNLA